MVTLSKHCPNCGLGYADFPGTEDSQLIEIDVKPVSYTHLTLPTSDLV